MMEADRIARGEPAPEAMVDSIEADIEEPDAAPSASPRRCNAVLAELTARMETGPQLQVHIDAQRRGEAGQPCRSTNELYAAAITHRLSSRELHADAHAEIDSTVILSWRQSLTR